MDVRYFITLRETFRQSLPPDQLQQQMTGVERKLGEVYWAGYTQDMWEVFVCLLGYCEERALDINTVKRKLFSMQNLSSKMGADEAVDILERRLAGDDFFRYARDFMTGPPRRFLSGVYGFWLMFGDQQILTRASTLDVLHECVKTCGADWPCVKECVKQSGG